MVLMPMIEEVSDQSQISPSFNCSLIRAQKAYSKFDSLRTENITVPKLLFLSVLEGLLTKSDQKLVLIHALLDLSAAFDNPRPCHLIKMT